MDTLQLHQIVENSGEEIKKHLTGYIGPMQQEILNETFYSDSDIEYSFHSSNYNILHVPSDVVATILKNDVGDYVFCLSITPNNHHKISDYFPNIIPSSNANGSPSVNLHSTQVENMSWIYFFFSTEDIDTQNKLLNSIKNENLKSKINAISNRENPSVNSIRHTEHIFTSSDFPSSTWKGGLFFTGSVNAWPFQNLSGSGILDFTDLTQFDIAGSIHRIEGVNYLNFQVKLGKKTFTSGPLKNAELSFILIETIDNAGEGAHFGINGRLEIKGANAENEFSVEVLGRWPDADNDLIELTSTAQIHNIPFFDSTSVPGLENHDTDIDINLNLKISKTTKSLEVLDFRTQLGYWDIIPEKLSLKNLEIRTTVLKPLSSKLVIASIEAISILGKNNIFLECGAFYPEGRFNFSLPTGSVIELHDIISAFFGHHKGMHNGLEVSKLDGSFNYSTKEILFDIEISRDQNWKIVKGFTMNSIRMEIRGQGQYEGLIYGQFAFGSGRDIMTFSVMGELGNGWSFSGEYDKGNSRGLNVASFYNKLKTAFGFKKSQLDLPDFIANITIENARLAFKTPTPSADGKIPRNNTKEIEKHFTLSATDTVNGTLIQFELKLDITYPKGKENIFFSGQMTINDEYVFDIKEQKSGSTKIFLASYHQNNDGAKVDISKVLAGLGVSGAPALDIHLKDAFFINENTPKFNLLVADVGAGMNLSNLPLVGKILPQNAKIDLALRVLYASAKYGSAVDDINQLLGDGIKSLPTPEAAKDKKGFDLIAEINIGENQYRLNLPLEIKNGHRAQNPITRDATPGSSNHESTKDYDKDKSPAIPVNEGITWFKIGKKFGPVVFNRIGLTFKNNELTVFPDAILSMGGLSFLLNGLSVSSPIDNFKPKFALKGLGLDFRKGPLEIGASFLRRQIVVQGETIDEFDGMAIISTEALTLSALGSYANYHGHPSLFIYAYLDQALGGPSFFFVEGLAAGFGYNRSLLMPTIDQVATFPLVRQVMSGEDPSKQGTDRAAMLTEQLDALSHYIPPSPGQMFFALGIKFSSFKLIDSFVLLAVSMGHHFEIDVLGQSDIVVPSVVPPGVPPLAEIKIQLMAKFLPEEGVLSVEARLTEDSYIFDKACQLTGGAAFYSWFKGEHEGDFVVTMGGYHPAFHVPEHYPQVPRLGLNWQIDPHMSVKGSMYFALCPHAFMAGGHLEANYHKGALKAWFKAGADFLISWQPYHYDAHLYLDIGASYTYHFFGTHHITVELGADVHVWGPKFAGRAKIHIWVVDITVSFGPQGKQDAKPIGWNAFIEKCLPEENRILSASILQGQHNETKDSTGNKKIPIVNPKELEFMIDSGIPIRTIESPTPIINPEEKSFGLAPMAMTKNVNSHLQIEILQNGNPLPEEEKEHLIFEPVKKKVPSAIWGKKFSPGLNDKDKTIELVTGVKVSTKEPLEFPSGGTHFKSRNELLDKNHIPRSSSTFKADYNYDYTTDESDIEDFKNDSSNKRFKRLCDDLGITGMNILNKV